MDFELDIENKKAVVNWLNQIRKGTGDARPLWRALTPRLNEFVNWQFRGTDNSGKRWKRLTPKYLEWKRKNNYFTGIGVRTGALKKATGINAVKTYSPKYLLWAVNPSIDYAKHFNSKRNIFRNIAARFNNFMKLDAKQFEDGKVHANFTYAWLRNILAPRNKK